MLTPLDAKRLIRVILDSGTVNWSGHVIKRMQEHRLTSVDCTNVLRAGVVEPGEWENGMWRYRVRGATICVVVTFRSEQQLAVITAWRITR
jgi:hypothetical protein